MQSQTNLTKLECYERESLGVLLPWGSLRQRSDLDPDVSQFQQLTKIDVQT